MTLNKIIYDLLNIIRGAKVVDNEPISERQIEAWIHQYRALYIKRDIDKNKYPNPDYIQSIDTIKLDKEDLAGTYSNIKTGDVIYKTEIKIPKGIDFNRESGIVFVGDLYGNRIQLVPESRVNFQQYKKFTNNDTIAYLNNQYIYVYNPQELEYISIRGIFENPTEVDSLINPSTDLPDFDYNSTYPIPINMIIPLKQDILKNELGIEWKAPSDDINDDSHINLDSDITK